MFSEHAKNLEDKLRADGPDAKHFRKFYIGYDQMQDLETQDSGDYSSANTEELL